MARLSDITSTEKLLRTIRSRKEEAAPASFAAAAPLRPKTGRLRIPLPRLTTLQTSSTVGIEIGPEWIRLVRAARGVGGQWRVIDGKSYPLPPETPREAPEFSAFLKASLADGCGSSRQSNLWAILSAENVDVRHIRIPKVAKKQVAHVVYWTLKKENPFDENEMLLDFETQGEVVDQGISKLSVMVYTAPRREVEELKALFSRIGWPLTGISIASFSTQNLFRTSWIPDPKATMASLFIGKEFSQIDIFSAGNLVMTRGIKAGLSSMVEALVYSWNERTQGPDTPPLTMEQGWKILRSLSPDSRPLKEGDAGFALKKEEAFEMVRPALERLARQVTRTFEYHATTMPGDRILRIHVSGAMNNHPPIVDYLGSQLGVESVALDPLGEQNEASCLEMGEARSVSERIAFGPALGLALSDNDRTPNLLFTYKDRERKASVIRINRAVFAAFIVSVLICTGIFTFQNHALAEKKRALAALEVEIANLGPPVNQERLVKMAAKAGERRQQSRVYADRYLNVIVISELAALTPPNIRFVDLKIRAGSVFAAADASKGKGKELPKADPGEVTVEGLILGEREMQETSLAGYAMTLESSPLFRKVTIQKSTVEPYLKGETLHFILNLKMEGPHDG